MFERILDGGFVHCLIDDGQALFLVELKRLLQPGGRVIISSMCGTAVTWQISALMICSTII